jgi:uncharacterized RDD family membrane protein YckC
MSTSSAVLDEPAVEPVIQPAAAEPDPEPLVKLPAEPRQPLAVRRSATETPAPKPKTALTSRKLGPLDRDLIEDLQRIEKLERREAASEARAVAREMAEAAGDVGPGKRLAAAVVDAVFLGGLSVALVWITLRWCDLNMTQLAEIPIWALVTFLVLVDVGYQLLFTAAGGQTIGKMLLGIRVIGDDRSSGHSPDVAQAFARALLTLPSVLALGLGFLPALVGDHRALHDRLAHTRVVRA